MIRRIVSYPRARWSRADAWANLNAQRYPGAPLVLCVPNEAGVWITSWRKSHTGTAWRWYADACEHGAGNPRKCERCQDDELESRDWLGLRDDLAGAL